MKRVVVDASVAVKWFLPEIHGEAAARLLEGRHVLLAPDLLFPEVGNVLWKRVSRGELSEEDAVAVLEALDAVSIELFPSRLLMQLALEIACGTRRTFYDSLYLALAVLHDCPMVTADRKFHGTIRVGPLAEHVSWVEDVVKSEG